MKRYIAIYIVFICLGAMSFSGCGAGVMKAGAPERVNEGEDTDPFSYGDEFSMVDFDKKTTSEPHHTLNSKKSKGDEPPRYNDIQNNRDKSKSTETRSRNLFSDVYGYRVQIGIDEDKEKMEKLEKYASLKVDVEVYLEFESPFYRVRVGDFVSKKEAETYVKKVKDIGFKDAIWVITKINAP